LQLEQILVRRVESFILSTAPEASIFHLRGILLYDALQPPHKAITSITISLVVGTSCFMSDVSASGARRGFAQA
jgi:hypothetical protein